MAVSVEIVVKGASEDAGRRVFIELVKEIETLCHKWDWDLELHDYTDYCFAVFADHLESEETAEVVDQAMCQAEIVVN